MGLFDAFTGSAQKKYLQQSNKQATNALAQGYTDANSRYDQAATSYDPYVQSGQRGQTAYENSLGLNGQAGAQSAYDAYSSNPAYQAANNYGMDSLAKKYNATGNVNSGANALAMARAGVENYGNYQNQLAGLGSQGLQATGAQSNVRAGQGDMAMGYGATRANQATGYGNALAQNASTGINNLLGLGGLAINGYSAWANPGSSARRGNSGGTY